MPTTLTEHQKSQIRSLCGYALSESSEKHSWRRSQAISTLNYRLDHLSAPEVAVMLQYLFTITKIQESLPRNENNEFIQDLTTWRPGIEEIRIAYKEYYQWCSRVCGFLGISSGYESPIIADV